MARRQHKPAGPSGPGLLAAAESQAAFRAAEKDGIGWGLELHRWVEPKDWPRELEARVPAEHRAKAEEYLRSIAQRMRNVRALKGRAQDGPPSK